MLDKPALRHRLAVIADLPAITALMDMAIAQNMQGFLSAEQIRVARQSMGLDQLLIEDGTYFVIEAQPPETQLKASGEIAQNALDVNALVDADNPNSWLMVGCGGWGKRRTLYGGDNTPGRDDRFSNPATDAARIRAMYTHPAWVRMGIGTLLLELSESAARDAGYRSIELGATTAGEPLYVANGYVEIERLSASSQSAATQYPKDVGKDDGQNTPLTLGSRDKRGDTVIKMRKSL